MESSAGGSLTWEPLNASYWLGSHKEGPCRGLSWRGPLEGVHLSVTLVGSAGKRPAKRSPLVGVPWKGFPEPCTSLDDLLGVFCFGGTLETFLREVPRSGPPGWYTLQGDLVGCSLDSIFSVGSPGWDPLVKFPCRCFPGGVPCRVPFGGGFFEVVPWLLFRKLSSNTSHCSVPWAFRRRSPWRFF